MQIHVYGRQQGGSLKHNIRIDEDYGGTLTVTGDIEQLAGWPTPAMRQAVNGAGEPTAWYIGTDADGSIVYV